MSRPTSRTKFSKAERDEILQRYTLLEAIRTGSVVQIGGVTLDMRCPLDPKQWQPLNPFGLYGSRASLWQPEIVFPWTPTDWREVFEKKGHALEAGPGSVVTLVVVGDRPLDMGFEELDDPENIARKLVYVMVRSPDGGLATAPQPLQYLQVGAVASLIPMGDYSGAYRGMLARLERLLGVEDVESLVDDTPVSDWPRLGPATSRSYVEALFALKAREEDFDGHAMAAFGYLIARAEAEDQLLALARRGAKNVHSTHAATAAKQAKNRQVSELVRDRARDVIRRRPHITLSACAREVTEAGEDQGWVHRTIKPLFIRDQDARTYRPRRSAELEV